MIMRWPPYVRHRHAARSRSTAGVLGPNFYDTRIGPERKNRYHIRQLEALGYQVTLEPTA
jgi:hypothetical protein